VFPALSAAPRQDDIQRLIRGIPGFVAYNLVRSEGGGFSEGEAVISFSASWRPVHAVDRGAPVIRPFG
jgi:hypothetical protein